MNNFGKSGNQGGENPCDKLPGIVILNRRNGLPVAPRIEAFIYGGDSQPVVRTLPYGRWKGAA